MSVTIVAPVGRGGRNRKTDTRRIQLALNAVYPEASLVVDGVCGAATIGRIEQFQRGFMQNPDARIDPGGLSLELLNEMLSLSSAPAADAGIEIRYPVGRGGRNLKSDTRRIQRALNEIYPLTPLAEDGLCGAATIRRIERFQRRFMKQPDGRIDPGGSSLESLNRLAPSLQPRWRGDSSKWSRDKKLDSLDPRLRVRIRRILERLEAEGFLPRIHYAWRSVAVQRELVREGRSTIGFSYHNAQFPGGRPRAYAVDVIDRRWGWGEPAQRNGFWRALGRAGRDEGLYWGGDWRRFRDYAHLQAFPNSRLAEIRRRSGLA